MNNVSNQQSPGDKRISIGIGKAILFGQLIVNMPAGIIIFCISSPGIVLALILWSIIPSRPDGIFYFGLIISVTIGGCCGWLWWSYFVPRWRRWALKNGVPEDKLQKWGVITGLLWPKGSIFEKTEFKLKD
jgi:hypothetical protein